MGRSKDIATSAKGDADYVNVSGDTMTGALTVDTQVGIGSSPMGVETLTVAKSSGTPTIRVNAPSGSEAQLKLQADGGGTDINMLHTKTDGSLSFSRWTGAAYTERMKIDNSGRVTMPYQVGFFARRTSHVTSSGDIVFTDVQFNRGSHYNASNGRFTAPVDGVYLFTFACLLYSMNSSSLARLDVNGSPYGGMSAFGTYGTFTGTYAGQSASAVAELNANDYVTIYFSRNTTNLHANYTWWSGFHLG